MKKKSLKLILPGVLIWALIIIVGGCKKQTEQPAPEPESAPITEAPEEPPAPPAEQPAPESPSVPAQTTSTPRITPGDPVRFIFYKAEQPTEGKEYPQLDLKVGEEITISVQALDGNGEDTKACPVSWKADTTILKLTPIAGNCKAQKVKALKATDSAVLTLVYKNAKGSYTEISLYGAIK